MKLERPENDMEAEVGGLCCKDGPKGHEPRNMGAPGGRTRPETEGSRRTQPCQRRDYGLVRVLVHL